MSISIPIKKLQKECNPFAKTMSPWGTEAITRSMVRKAIKEGRLQSQHGTEDHVERIAYLAVNHVKDPIEIDVGAPIVGYVPESFIQDGHHRLAAAIINGDSHIEAEVSGQIDFANKLFGVDCME